MGKGDYYQGGPPPQPQYGQPGYGQGQSDYGQGQPLHGHGQHAGYNIPQADYGPPPPYSFNPPHPNDTNYSFDQAFKLEKPKYNDVWAGILFIGVFIGYVVISALAIRGFASGGAPGKCINDGTNSFSLNSNTLILFSIVLLVAWALSLAYVWMIRLFPKQIIWATGILNLALAVATAGYLLYKKQWVGGIIPVVYAVFLIIAFWSWIPRIPFSALMLKTTISVSKRYGHVYLVSFIGGFIGIALAGWYAVTLVAIYVRWEPSNNNPHCTNGGCSNAKVIGFLVYVTFAMYWMSEWFKNTIHTTISGVYGTWYFCVHNFPKGATRGALKRCLTYSFGSISLGSLILAIVQFLRQLLSIGRQQASDEGGVGGIVLYIIFCIVECLVGLIEWAIEFLNRYAFSMIALYGKSYFAAAKDTWRMIKDRGIDALVNECLIGPVLSFGTLFIAIVSMFIAYVYLILTNPAYNRAGGFTAPIVAFAFLIGLQVANIFTTPISSGVDAIFVASGWDPQVMINDHPELYQEMVRVFPKVQQAIQVR